MLVAGGLVWLNRELQANLGEQAMTSFFLQYSALKIP
jgi:hypothetical protein